MRKVVWAAAVSCAMVTLRLQAQDAPDSASDDDFMKLLEGAAVEEAPSDEGDASSLEGEAAGGPADAAGTSPEEAPVPYDTIALDRKLPPMPESKSERGGGVLEEIIVASYMAEVVAPRGQSSQTSGDGAGPGALFDLQNVQVLKGPQGTLFGRNTTDGAVLLVPNRPGDEFEGYIELSGGERGSIRQQGVVNLPMTDNFKVRLAVDRNERDGHLKNITHIGTDELASVDYISARFSTRWNVTEEIDNYTIVSYIDSQSTGFSSQLYACNAGYAADPSNFFLVFAGALHVPACQDQLARQKAAGQDDFYDMVSTIKTPKTDITEKRLINTLSWNLNEGITLTNILAYAHLHTENGSDIFGTQFRYNAPLLSLPVIEIPVFGSIGGPIPLDPNPAREFKTGVSVVNPDIPVTSQETYVAELQLQGQSFEGALEWQGGLYYENSRPDGFSGNNSAGWLTDARATSSSPRTRASIHSIPRRSIRMRSASRPSSVDRCRDASTLPRSTTTSPSSSCSWATSRRRRCRRPRSSMPAARASRGSSSTPTSSCSKA